MAKPRPTRLSPRLERRTEARLVRVEVVRPHGRERRLSRASTVCEQSDRERRVGSGTREAGGWPELAHEQPALGLGDVAAPEARQHPPVGGAEHRRLEPRSTGGELDLVAAHHGALDAEVGRSKLLVAQEGSEAGDDRRCFPYALPGTGVLAHDQRPLGVRERRPQVCCEPPGRLVRRLGQPEQAGPPGPRRARRAARRAPAGARARPVGYCSIATPSCAAACET